MTTNNRKLITWPTLTVLSAIVSSLMAYSGTAAGGIATAAAWFIAGMCFTVVAAQWERK